MAGSPAVDRRDQLAREFERHRSHLRGVAYRMLGSVAEADDAVQEHGCASTDLTLAGTEISAAG